MTMVIILNPNILHFYTRVVKGVCIYKETHCFESLAMYIHT